MLNVEPNRYEMTETIAIHKDEIDWDFKRASKPGGTAANSQAVGAELRYDINASESLPREVKEKLQKVAESKINKDGELVIYSEDERSQQENRESCIEKLRSYIEKAAEPDEERLETNPPREAKEEWLEEKKRHGRKKELRQPIQPEEYRDVNKNL